MSHGLCGSALLSGPFWMDPAFPLFDKAALRAQALGRRAGVPAAAREAFASRLAAVGPRLARGAVASCFASFRDEVDTAPLMTALRAAGIGVALPVVAGRGEPLVFRVFAVGDPTKAGPFGIREPIDELPAVEPDTLFVPLAAFDGSGHRIGYGGGFYDRTLAGLRARKPIRAIGVAFECQKISCIPAESHDQKLDMIVTETDVIEFT